MRHIIPSAQLWCLWTSPTFGQGFPKSVTLLFIIKSGFWWSHVLLTIYNSISIVNHLWKMWKYLHTMDFAVGQSACVGRSQKLYRCFLFLSFSILFYDLLFILQNILWLSPNIAKLKIYLRVLNGSRALCLCSKCGCLRLFTNKQPCHE